MVQEARPFTLQLLGGFSFEPVDGENLSLTLRKGEALLAYLATIPSHSASRETLASLLWSDSDSRRARQSLRRLLFDLARSFSQLDRTILHVDGNKVSLANEDIDIDVSEFEELAESKTKADLLQAANLYRGRFLKDFNIEAMEFENWLEQTRDRLEHKALNCLGNLLDQLQHDHQYDQAIAIANQALNIDYYREDIHRQLMDIFMANGMRSSALSHYRSLKNVLSRELQVEPDADTRKLYEEILSKEPGTDSPGSRRQQGPAAAGTLEQSPKPEGKVQELFEDLLIGRQEEFDGLMQLYRQMRSGNCAIAAITGPKGIGKSHLTRVFLGRLPEEKIKPVILPGTQRQDSCLLATLIHEFDNRIPQDLTLRITRHMASLDRLGERDSFADITKEQRDRKIAETESLIVETLQYLTAKDPLVLAIDDVESYDAVSIATVFSMLSKVPGASLFLIVTFSGDDGLGQRLANEFLDATRDIRAARLFRLRNLTESQTTRLATKLQELTLRKFDLRCSLTNAWAESAGNPGALAADFARALSNLGRGELQGSGGGLPDFWDDLTQDEKETALLCAALGPLPIKLELIEALSTQAEESLEAALNRLCESGVLTSEAGSLCFAEESARSLFYSQLPATRRRKIHKFAIEWIRRTYGLNLGPYLEVLSYHEHKLGRLEASLFCELALAQRELEREHTAAAQLILEKIIEKSRELNNNRSAAQITVEAYLGLAAIAETHQDNKSLGGYLQRAQELVGPYALDYQAALVNAASSRKARLDGEFSLACEFARRANRAERRSGVECLSMAADRFFAKLHLVTKSQQEVRRAMTRQLESAASGERPQEEIEAASCLAFYHAIEGDSAASHRCAAHAMSVAERLGNERLGAACHQYLGMVYGSFAEFDRAQEEFDRAREMATVTGDIFRIYHALGYSAQSCLLSGDAEEADHRLKEALKYAREAEMRLDLPLFSSWQAETAIIRDQLEEGRVFTDTAFKLAAELNHHFARGIALRCLAQYLWKTEERDQLGAEKALRSALSTFRSLRLEVEAARTEIVLAKVLRGSGKLAEASQVFRRASERFQRIGIAGESEKARVLADALTFS